MDQSAPEIGAQIRARRRLQGLTLEALAERSGVSAAMLSEVERSVKNPTVKLAWQVARALGCTLTEILDEPGEGATLVRAADRRALVDQDTGIARYGVSTSLLSSALEVATYVLPAGASTGEMTPNRAGVVEHVIVVRGRLLLGLGGEQIELTAGDHITYRPQTAVEYRAGRGSCEFVLLSDRSATGVAP
jgi:transcriptional regulator with XRE-family HTH domain